MTVELQNKRPPAKTCQLEKTVASEIRMILESDFAKYLPETTRRKLNQALLRGANERPI